MKLPKISKWNKELVVAIAAAAVIAIVFIAIDQLNEDSGQTAQVEAKNECDRWNDDAVATMASAISIRKSETVSEEDMNTLADELQTMNTSRPEGCESSERLLELHEEYRAELGF